VISGAFVAGDSETGLDLGPVEPESPADAIVRDIPLFDQPAKGPRADPQLGRHFIDR
jgi:hypothetical protein